VIPATDMWTPEPEFLHDVERFSLDRAQHPDHFTLSPAVAPRLRDARIARQLSRGQLAVLSGVGDFQIQLLEQGVLPDSEVAHDELDALASALAIELDQLLASDTHQVDEPREDWSEVIRSWGQGFLNATRGRWNWRPMPVTELRSVHAIPTGSRRRAAITLLDGATLQVEAGVEFAGGAVVLLQLREDRQGYRPVEQATLDQEGSAHIALPTDDLRLSVAVMPARA
jgi:transcriptional regulator with XRE-family HTH domain